MQYYEKYLKYKNLYLKLKTVQQPKFKMNDMIMNIEKGKTGTIVCLRDEIYEKEKYFIKKYDSFKSGLNSTIGGEGCTGYKHSKSVRKKISTSLLNGNSHKGKTYDDIYGKNSNIEKKKRGITAKRNWKNLTIKQKEKKIKKITSSIQNKSKYGVELVTEIKNKFKEGHKVKDLKFVYPQVTKSFLYDLKNNRRWKNV